MSKKGGSQTVTQNNTLDPTTQQWVQDVYGAAKGAARRPGVGVDPMSQSAAAFFGNAAQAGNLGFGALSGDPTALNSLMNPYLDSVIGRVQADQERLNAGTLSAVGEAATKAGAFGGSRHGVAEGAALADVNRESADLIAQLRAGGYNDAMGRAGTLANLGMGSAYAQHMMGDYTRNVTMQNDPTMRRLNIMRESLIGLPYGQTQTNTTPTERNGSAGFLGGAATGAGIGSAFGPWGTAIGAGLGGLISLF